MASVSGSFLNLNRKLQGKKSGLHMTKMDVLDNSKLASMLSQLKFEDPEDPSLLHALASSGNPTKHALASSMIERGADVSWVDSRSNGLLYVAVQNEAFSVIEALLKKASLGNYYQYKHIMELAMHSQNFVRLLTLFFKYNPDVTLCCEGLPWDMSDDHLAKVAKTLVRLACQKKKSGVGQILEFVSTKNSKLAKDLLNCRNEKNEKLIDLQKLLSYSLKSENPAVTTFLLREGADVNDCVNDEKKYPLHLACKYQKLGTAQLLLQLGADVNVTDRFGITPFSTIPIHAHQERDYVFIAKLMIKHFACLISMGRRVNEKDLVVIRRKPNLQEFYDLCIEELDRMKTITAAGGLSYYCFFIKSTYELSLLMRNPKIFDQLRKSLLPTVPLKKISIFKTDMMTKFGVARQMRNILLSKERELEEIFSENLPSIVLRDIARFSLDFKRLEKDYHLTKSSWYYNNHFLNVFINATI